MFILQKLSYPKNKKKLPLLCNLVCVSVFFLADATHTLGVPGPAGAGPRHLSSMAKTERNTNVRNKT